MKIQSGELRPKINGDGKDLSEYLRIIGDNHTATSKNTPLRKDAFSIDDTSKIFEIAAHFKEIMNIIGLDLSDDSLKGTPMRVASMYIDEIFSGLNPKNKPDVTLFENKYDYKQMIIEKDIRVNSFCEHHFVPIIGKAHVAYISNGFVIGLSKINRIVEYFSRRPQVQERLTEQIAEELKKVLHTDDLAIVIEAEHMCVAIRGIKDHGSSTITSSYHGKFLDEISKKEFLTHLYSSKQ
jgi:GTP cyclohydrolase IA